MAAEGKPRLDPRIAVRLRVDIQYPLRGAHWRRGETYDLSASGSCCRCELDLPLKAQVGCRIYLPPAGGEGESLIDTDAVVVRVDSPEPGSREWRYGLYFVNLSETDFQSLKRFVYASREAVT
ncbi:MAG: PilZ domain-containing protein [Acidobacteria bacterium]|nr:PilZ domain-containing protein [Acidobacteriota bacterium]